MSARTAWRLRRVLAMDGLATTIRSEGIALSDDFLSMASLERGGRRLWKRTWPVRHSGRASLSVRRTDAPDAAVPLRLHEVSLFGASCAGDPRAMQPGATELELTLPDTTHPVRCALARLVPHAGAANGASSWGFAVEFLEMSEPNAAALAAFIRAAPELNPSEAPP
jgi:hypothetical protein